jgi:hypothetical protein
VSRHQQQRNTACLALARRRWVTSHFTPGGTPPVDAIRLWLIGYLRAGFARGRASLHLQPAVRIALDAGEAAAVGLVDEFFARLAKLFTLPAVKAFFTGIMTDVLARVPQELPMANQPNQPNPGQPANQAGQPQHAALTAAGAPQEHAAALASAGVTPDQAKQLAAVQGFNWQALLAAVQQYGPQIVAVILSILGKTTP